METTLTNAEMNRNARISLAYSEGSIFAPARQPPTVRSVYRKTWARMSDVPAFASDTPLQAVSPDDLKRVWHFARAVQETAKAAAQPGGVGIDVRLVEKQCQPGADVMAVFFRAALLQGLFDQGLLDEWREGDQPRDSVFDVAATFPLEGGVQGFDFDAFKERLTGTITA